MEFTAANAEISFGVLWLPIKDKSIRPYLGAGIAGVSAACEAEAFGISIDDDDQDFGCYLNGGCFAYSLLLGFGWGK